MYTLEALLAISKLKIKQKLLENCILTLYIETKHWIDWLWFFFQCDTQVSVNDSDNYSKNQFLAILKHVQQIWLLSNGICMEKISKQWAVILLCEAFGWNMKTNTNISKDIIEHKHQNEMKRIKKSIAVVVFVTFVDFVNGFALSFKNEISEFKCWVWFLLFSCQVTCTAR